MDGILETYLSLFVWLFVICLMGFFIKMVGWAKKQKGAAMAFGMLVQMFLPDPNAQATIECVAESKQEKRNKAQALQGDDEEKEEQ